jgi:hypothetical protein
MPIFLFFPDLGVIEGPMSPLEGKHRDQNPWILWPHKSPLGGPPRIDLGPLDESRGHPREPFFSRLLVLLRILY